MSKPQRDWTRTGTIEALAGWMQREGDVDGNAALAVIVMREKDGALAVSAAIAVKDVEAMMCAHLAPLLEDLARNRAEGKKPTARVKWEEVGE
jgi:hypothetical protein